MSSNYNVKQTYIARKCMKCGYKCLINKTPCPDGTDKIRSDLKVRKE